MKRRTALKTAGASILAGSTLSTSATAKEGDGDHESFFDRFEWGDGAEDDDDDGPEIVAVESEARSAEGDTNDQYSVEYTGDGTVVITGLVVAPTPCHEIAVDGIEGTRHGDIVELGLELVLGPNESCIQVLSPIEFTVELEYENEPEDVFVSLPDDRPSRS